MRSSSSIIFVTSDASESPRPIANSLVARRTYRPNWIVDAFRELEANWSAYADDLTASQAVRTLPVWQAMGEVGQN